MLDITEEKNEKWDSERTPSLIEIAVVLIINNGCL